MLSRLFIALALAAALVGGGALAFLRTDFVANNLCAYAVATIEEATLAQVTLARCSVEPAAGQLTIEGLHASDPSGRIDLKVARIFVHVVVRPLRQRVRLERLEVDYPELRLAVAEAKGEGNAGPAQTGGRCLPDVLDRFELGRVKIRKASVDVRDGDVHVAVPRATIAIKGRDDVLRVSVATRAAGVEVPGRRVDVISSRVNGAIDLHGVGTVDLRKADVIGQDFSAFVSGKLVDLCEPRVEATVNARADDLQAAVARYAPGVLRGVKGAISTDATVTLQKGDVRAKGDLRVKRLALEGIEPGDASLRFDLTPQRVKVDRLELPLGKGVVGGEVTVAFVPSLPFAADLTLRDAEVADLLRKLGSPHSPVVVKASGRTSAKGELSPLRLAGEVALDVAELAVLDRPYDDRRSKSRDFEMPSGHVASAFTLDADKLVLGPATITAGESQIEAEGTFFTDSARGMQLVAHAEALDLDDFGSHVGSLSAHGLVDFDATVEGPYPALRIDASTDATDFHFMGLALGDVSSRLGLSTKSMMLSIDQIHGRRNRSEYSGRVTVGLSGDTTPIDAHVELAHASLHDLVGLLVGKVSSLSTLADAQDFEGEVEGVLDAKGDVEGPDGSAALRFGAMRVFGQTFQRGRARFTLRGGKPRLQVDELVLEHGDDARFVVGGRVGPAWELDLTGRTERFTLADVDPGAPAHLTGPLAASVHVGGITDHPVVEIGVKFFQAMAGKAALGDGDAKALLDDKTLTWNGTVGTHSLKGKATLDGDFPYSCSASLRVPDLRHYLELLVPEAEVQRGSLAAEVQLEGSLLDPRRSTGTVTLSQLELVKSDMQFDNDGPAKLTVGPEGISIEHLSLRAPYTTAQLQGRRVRGGRLDLRLTASVDGRLMQGLVPDVEHASGTWLVQATVSGTEQAPTVLGNLRIENGEVRLRGLPVAAREVNGSISFSQDALVIDAMTGKLNNGEARISGGMEMKHLRPERIDMSAHVSDVNVKLQESIGATLDGDLTLFGPPLEPVLGGSLIVSRLKYTEDLDVEKSLLDFSRRPPTPKVLTKSPVLVRFDLDVHLSRGVRVENNLARTDLKGDLKITGNSREVGLLGSINTVHGTAAFRGNEFQIEQGVLSFNDRQQIRPSFDFQASSVIKAGQEYKVRLHAFGTPGDPHLSWSSEPALAEADIGFLLTFGFVSQQMQQSSFGAADSGLAIGVEALNKMTGFSDEVRRFIPKNAILRDPNIDFASDFSVATNRLEPMARFRSHMINDRMDLKVLEGLTTRRYRGVISYQLSDLFSTQLQLDNEHVTQGTDFGADLRFKWEGE